MGRILDEQKARKWTELFVVHCSASFLVLVTILDFLFARLWVHSLFIAILFFHNPALVGAILRWQEAIILTRWQEWQI